MKAPSPTKLGMIGCGLIANAHGLAAARSRRDVRFTACSSRSRSSAQAFADEFSCDYVSVDHEALFAEADIDGIVIASPPDTHASIIHDAIGAGIRYILCEKPLTMTADEAVAVQASADAAGATVVEGFMYRHHPQIPRLLELVHSGELGTVDQIHCVVNMLDASEKDGTDTAGSWRREQQAGGVLHDFLCYPIDLANLIVRQQPTRATARVFASPRYGTPYRAFGALEYGNGTVANIGASRLSDFAQPLIIGCEKGTVHLATAFNPIGDTEIVIQRSQGLIGLRRESITVRVPEPISERLLDLPVFTWQLEHFADLIGRRCEPVMTLQESVRNARTRDAFIAAGGVGTPVR